MGAVCKTQAASLEVEALHAPNEAPAARGRDRNQLFAIDAIDAEARERLEVANLRRFAGRWVSRRGHSHIIDLQRIQWASGYTSELEFFRRPQGGLFCAVELQGFRHEAEITPDDRLRWSDGDMWVRGEPDTGVQRFLEGIIADVQAQIRVIVSGDTARAQQAPRPQRLLLQAVPVLGQCEADSYMGAVASDAAVFSQDSLKGLCPSAFSSSARPPIMAAAQAAGAASPLGEAEPSRGRMPSRTSLLLPLAADDGQGLWSARSLGAAPGGVEATPDPLPPAAAARPKRLAARSLPGMRGVYWADVEA